VLGTCLPAGRLMRHPLKCREVERSLLHDYFRDRAESPALLCLNKEKQHPKQKERTTNIKEIKILGKWKSELLINSFLVPMYC